jgi:hypothetical protein
MGSMDDLAGQGGGDHREAPEDPYLTGDGTTPTRPRHLAWMVTSGAVVLVLVVGAVLITKGARTGGGPAQVDGPITEVAPAAPWDGKASMRLPVTITPNRDLVDGQEVTVSASGFPPHADLGVLMCTNAAAFGGISACDISTASSSVSGTPVVADAQGNVTTTYRVRTRFTVMAPQPVSAPVTSMVRDGGVEAVIGSVPATPAQAVDCTDGDIDPDVWPSVVPKDPSQDPGGFTCIVAIGMITDYDKSGGAAVGFSGSVFKAIDTTTTTAPTDPASTAPGAPLPSTAPTAPPAPGQTTPTSAGPQPPVTRPSSSTTTSPDPPAPPPIDPRSTTTTTGPPGASNRG